METIEDFDKWLAEYKAPEYNYVAVFDPNTGAVESVGPDFAFLSEKHKIIIDKDLAHSIIAAEIQIHNCKVDLTSGEISVAEIKTLNKLDDVLHRIISVGYSDTIEPDVYLTYNKTNKTLTIELSADFGGTKIYGTQKKVRNIIWDGSTIMDYLITEYNDPNQVLKVISVRIDELIGKSLTVENIIFPRFSVYTKRLFKKYVIEYQ